MEASFRQAGRQQGRELCTPSQRKEMQKSRAGGAEWQGEGLTVQQNLNA